ncbi:cell wall hydrolase [Mangrovicoccus ximenensis]|uniref:cell wall hydrolase n=1 Tax=Mangrovicoccus ximenensis TaxID=1911570 RepID=UPI0013750CE9|nr:cell wall hydrolase [Mangrovicoccus ximenensis]
MYLYLFRALLGSLLFACLLAAPLPAQSLFQPGGFGARPASDGGAPFFSRAAAPIRASAPVPLIEQRALALADTGGLAARRRNFLAPFSGQGYSPPNARAVREEAAWLAANPPRDFSRETDLMCIAVSIYHEARNQPRDGQAAVASVILTRAADPMRWGMTPCSVVVPVQFSYLTPKRGFAPIRDLHSWSLAVEIAAEVLMAGPDPRLKGADHYHATYVDPVWNKHMDLVERIADHLFWRSRPEAS